MHRFYGTRMFGRITSINWILVDMLCMQTELIMLNHLRRGRHLDKGSPAVESLPIQPPRLWHAHKPVRASSLFHTTSNQSPFCSKQLHHHHSHHVQSFKHLPHLQQCASLCVHSRNALLGHHHCHSSKCAFTTLLWDFCKSKRATNSLSHLSYHWQHHSVWHGSVQVLLQMPGQVRGLFHVYTSGETYNGLSWSKGKQLHFEWEACRFKCWGNLWEAYNTLFWKGGRLRLLKRTVDGSEEGKLCFWYSFHVSDTRSNLPFSILFAITSSNLVSSNIASYIFPSLSKKASQPKHYGPIFQNSFKKSRTSSRPLLIS